MFRHRKLAKRFSLLLLDEEEDYVADWVATCKWPSSVSGCWSAGATTSAALEGRVRLCTRSLFFEPDDVKVPIVRLPFSSTQQLEAGGGPGASCTLTCTSLTKMKANMQEVPYVFEKGKTTTWVFQLTYAPLSAFLPMAQQLLAANKLPKLQRCQALEAYVRAHEDSFVFDTSRLVDFSERILLDTPATQLTPLVRERGHLLVTNTRLYFQPLHNVSGDNPVRSHPLSCVAAIARRRSSLLPLGLEVFFVRPSDTHTLKALAASQQGRLDPSRATSSSGAGAAAGLQGAVGGSQGQLGGGMAMGHSNSMGQLELGGTGPVWDGPSAFFAFRSEAEREAVARQLSSCPSLGAAIPHTLLTPASVTGGAGSSHKDLVHVHSCLLEAQGGWLMRVTAAWQAARISNFDYLMYINLAAGRSFNDLAQWPVLPWVLCNWVSEQLDLTDPANFRDLTKPVGALNPARLREFRKRYEEMPHDSFEEGAVPPFLYGTHYSTPGYVMYWLLRAAPAHMLRLQNGRFDAPDRLFHSMEESWRSVNNSSTDVKELIPEFYLPGGSWLVNAQRLPLGVRQNGRPVGDVVLPPWAKDPEHFLAMHRAALEAPPVSRTLHHWVDLIFGYKQRGAAAEAADNLFYHLTYEGAVDVTKVTDPVELSALETQINEFGQTPRQLFLSPHPARAMIPPAPDPATVFSTLMGEGSSASSSSGGNLAVVVGPGGASATTSTTTTTASMYGVGGSESGHRALALVLISAISQAAAFEPGEGGPMNIGSQVEGAGGQGQGGALHAGGGTPKGPFATPEVQQQGATPVAGPAGTSTVQPGSAKAAEQGTVLGSNSNREAGDSWAGSMVSAAGNMLGGLLKLGRYKSGGLGGSSSARSSTPGLPDTPTAGAQHSLGRPTGEAAAGTASTPSTTPAKAQNFTLSPAAAAAAAAAGSGAGSGGVSNRTGQAMSSPSLHEPGDQAGVQHTDRSYTSFQARGLSVTSPQSSYVQVSAPSHMSSFVHVADAAAFPSTSLESAGGREVDGFEQLSDLDSILNQPEATTTTSAPASAIINTAAEPGSQAPKTHDQPPAATTPPALPSHSADGKPQAAHQAALAQARQESVGVTVTYKCDWSEGLPERLAAASNGQRGAGARSLVLPVARDPISGVAVWRTPSNAGGWPAYVCCTTTGGLLRVLQLSQQDMEGPPPASNDRGPSSLTQSQAVFRSHQLEGDVLCVAPLPGITAAFPAAQHSGSSHTWSHPLILTGSHNQRVYAYSVEQGQLLGSFQAHEDAVCAVAVPPTFGRSQADPAGHSYGGGGGSSYGEGATPPRRFFTSSWDCTIKAWGLGGTPPWSVPAYSPPLLPEATWDCGQGVWALAAGQESSYLVVGGTEEGCVVACDVRAAAPVWSVSVAQDYVGGLALTPCGHYVTAGTADGALTLLDMRHMGTRLAVTHTPSPVRCCVSDSRLVLAGTEAGSVHMWDVGLMCAAYTQHVGGRPPGPDGQYRPWKPPTPGSPTSAGSCEQFGGGGGGGDGMEMGGARSTAIAAMAVNAYGTAEQQQGGGGGVDLVLGTESGHVIFTACS